MIAISQTAPTDCAVVFLSVCTARCYCIILPADKPMYIAERVSLFMCVWIESTHPPTLIRAEPSGIKKKKKMNAGQSRFEKTSVRGE